MRYVMDSYITCPYQIADHYNCSHGCIINNRIEHAGHNAKSGRPVKYSTPGILFLLLSTNMSKTFQEQMK